METRANELAALAETIKILNDDDALELFQEDIDKCLKLRAGGSRSSDHAPQ